ncbi:MAG: radical SAM protein [Promethearchaeota archaeon]
MTKLFNEKLVSPLVVFWELTRRCNLRCSHCYTHSGNTDFQLSNKNLRYILDVICEKNIFSLGLGGGEPSLVKILPSIIYKASKNEIDVSLSTNGILMTLDKAKQLKDAGLVLAQVSIDGVELTHEAIRGKGTFKLAIEALKNAKKAGITTRLGMTINKLNYKQIENVFNLALDLGVDWFIAFRYMETGREGNTLALTQNSLKKATQTLIKIHKEYPFRIFFEKLVFLPFLIDIEYKSLKSCNAGKSIMNIKANGDVTPCPHTPEPIVGNILKDKFEQIWNCSEIEMTDCKAKECENCDYVDFCGGGCKGVVYLTKKRDPLCWA